MTAATELLMPAALRLGLLLGAGLLGVAAATRGRLSGNVFYLRWRTWALSAPLFLAAVVWPWATVVFVGALAVQGSREFARLVRLSRPATVTLVATAAVSVPFAVWDFTSWRALPPLLLLVATLPPLLTQDVRRGATDLAFSALGFGYIPYLLTYLWLIRARVDGGAGVLLALGVAVACSDVGAFVAGKALGRRGLAPRLSPAKTVEGLAGNVIGAYAGFALMAFALPASVPRVIVWVLPLLVAAACVWGDLLESLLKRQFDAKDSGAWLPGFGGLLDRIDSLLVAAPLVYTALVVGPWLLAR